LIATYVIIMVIAVALFFVFHFSSIVLIKQLALFCIAPLIGTLSWDLEKKGDNYSVIFFILSSIFSIFLMINIYNVNILATEKKEKWTVSRFFWLFALTVITLGDNIQHLYINYKYIIKLPVLLLYRTVLSHIPMAFLEECVFRIFPYYAIAERYKKIPKPIIYLLVGLVFAVSHGGNLWVFLFLLMESLQYSILYDRTKSFFLIGSLHLLYNVSVTLLQGIMP